MGHQKPHLDVPISDRSLPKGPTRRHRDVCAKHVHGFMYDRFTQGLGEMMQIMPAPIREALAEQVVGMFQTSPFTGIVRFRTIQGGRHSKLESRVEVEDRAKRDRVKVSSGKRRQEEHVVIHMYADK